MSKKNYMFDKLKEHIGHSIEIVGYGNGKIGLYATLETTDFVNVSIECLDCNEVLIDYDNKD